MNPGARGPRLCHRVVNNRRACIHGVVLAACVLCTWPHPTSTNDKRNDVYVMKQPSAANSVPRKSMIAFHTKPSLPIVVHAVPGCSARSLPAPPPNSAWPATRCDGTLPGKSCFATCAADYVPSLGNTPRATCGGADSITWTVTGGCLGTKSECCLLCCVADSCIVTVDFHSSSPHARCTTEVRN